MNNVNSAAHLILSNEGEHIGLTVSMGPEGVKQFRNILQRALNCAPPQEEQYKDWFELADLLEGRKEIKGQPQKD